MTPGAWEDTPDDLDREVRAAVMRIAGEAAPARLRARVTDIPAGYPRSAGRRLWPPAWGPSWRPLGQPHRLSIATAVVTALVVMVVALAGPLGPWPGRSGPGPGTSTASAGTAGPDASPSALPCEPAASFARYEIVGWRAGRIDLVWTRAANCSAGSTLVSVDPWTGDVRTEADVPGVAGPSATDGRSVAIAYVGGDLTERILVVGGTRRIVDPPEHAMLRLVAAPAGGYLLAASPRLILLASDGSRFDTQALPTGYDTVSATSDPDRYLLAPSSEVEGSAGAPAWPPVHLYLWSRRSGGLVPVAGVAEWRVASGAALALARTERTGPGSADGLNFDSTWWLVGRDAGRTRLTAIRGVWSLPDPEGRFICSVSRAGQTTVTDTVVVRAIAGDRVIAERPFADGLEVDAAAWAGTSVAVLAQGSKAGQLTAELIVVRDGEVRSIALP